MGDRKETYDKYNGKMKEAMEAGLIDQALLYAEKAYRLQPSDRLGKRIAKIKKYLSESSDEDEVDPNTVQLGDGFYLNSALAKQLYGYQKSGISWMWRLSQARKGGILGDDMGLGKTLQIIAFLTGMFEQEHIKSVLILMPMTLIANWLDEFEKWSPDLYVYEFHAGTKLQREKNLQRVQKKGGVLLSTYGMVVNNWDVLKSHQGRKFQWDYVILDEGHKIKNNTKTTRAVHELPAANRLVLSGTPLQNKLSELWSLFDFAHQGTLLGTARTFKIQFESPINQSRERDASPDEKILGQKMAEQLRYLIAPYFLRRTKAEVLERSASGDPGTAKPKALLRKNDFVLWVFMSKEQQKLYNDFLQDSSVQEILMTNKSPLIQLNILKKICDHPRLLTARACAELELEGHDRFEDDDQLQSQPSIDNLKDETLLNESGKMQVLMQLLKNLRDEGNRTLVFSQSRRILDIIQRLLRSAGIGVVRIDGLVKSSLERQSLVQKFENDLSVFVCLLTSQVGGVGLTLTGANRVVIYDPSWNPATDSQAVDRAYRIGQSRTVIVYRLISCGTVEEKIYRRQVFKNSITRQATGDANPIRYFSRAELHDMFNVEDFNVSHTQRQLQEMHAAQRQTDVELDHHIAFLYSLDIYGISDNDLLFTLEESDEAVDDDSNQQIRSTVGKARQLVSEECQRTQTAIESSGRYNRDEFNFPQPGRGGNTNAATNRGGGGGVSDQTRRPREPKRIQAHENNWSDGGPATVIANRIKNLGLDDEPKVPSARGAASGEKNGSTWVPSVTPARGNHPLFESSPIPSVIKGNSSVIVVAPPTPESIESVNLVEDSLVSTEGEEEEEYERVGPTPSPQDKQILTPGRFHNRQSVLHVVESPVESDCSSGGYDDGTSELGDIIPDAAFSISDEVSLVVDADSSRIASTNRRRSGIHAFIEHELTDEDTSEDEKRTVAFDSSQLRADDDNGDKTEEDDDSGDYESFDSSDGERSRDAKNMSTVKRNLKRADDAVSVENGSSSQDAEDMDVSRVVNDEADVTGPSETSSRSHGSEDLNGSLAVDDVEEETETDGSESDNTESDSENTGSDEEDDGSEFEPSPPKKQSKPSATTYVKPNSVSAGKPEKSVSVAAKDRATPEETDDSPVVKKSVKTVRRYVIISDSD